MELQKLTQNSTYRLQSVLDVREQAVQEASRRVRIASSTLTAAEEELARREQAIADCKSNQETAQAMMNEVFVSGLRANELLMHRRYMVNLKEQEERLKGESQQQSLIVRRASEEVDKARLVLLEASKEVQVIKKHRATWRQQIKKDVERRDQKAIDEAAAVIHRSQQQQSK